MENGAKKPLLSICIPTYNRAEYLKKSIETIILQEEFKNGDVEIVVSDNASDDQTRDMMELYARSHSNIFYERNEENIQDANFPKVLSNAHGTYRRLCNDTLCFHEGSLKYICEIIESSSGARPFISWANGAVSCDEKSRTKDFQDYVQCLSFQMTAISCFGIWEEECSQIEYDLDGTELRLWQVRKGLELAYRNGQIIIANRKLTDIQSIKKKDISYGLYKVFYQNFFELLSPYFDNSALDTAVREYLEKDLLYGFFTPWCIQWELGARHLSYSQSENLKDAIFQHYRDKKYWKKYSFYYRAELLRELGKRAARKVIGR